MIPRAHAQDVQDIAGPDLAATIDLAQQIARAARERLGADGVNLLNSSGAAAWQTVFHFHIHVIPRYEGDPLRLPWVPSPGDPEQIAAAAAALARRVSDRSGRAASFCLLRSAGGRVVLNKAMRNKLVLLVTIAVLLLIPALASGTLTEVGSVGLPFGTPSPVGPTGKTGATGKSGKSGKKGKTTSKTGKTGTTGPTSTGRRHRHRVDRTGRSDGPVASCPSAPCEVLSETTGMQVKVGSHNAPITIPRNGVIVAWTIHLSAPTAAQIAYFNQHEGGPAEAGIAILKQTKALNYTLVAQSPLVQLQPYFGGTAQFPLANTIPVQKGERVALTVPTWAPALAIKLGNTTSWRASRPRHTCTSATEASTQTAQTTAGSNVQYACLYQTARLLYTATLISTP